MALPTSWTEVLDRLDRRLGGPSPATETEAHEWLREAVEAAYGVGSIHELGRGGRQIVFQKATGVLLALEEEGVPLELARDGGPVLWLLYRDGTLEPAAGQPTRRERVARAFARYFGGAALSGPPWRLSPAETERPLFDEWAATADFG